MSVYLVVLEHGEKLMVKKDWIKKPELFVMTKIFFAPNQNVDADFSLPCSKVFHSDRVACYLGVVCQYFGKLMLIINKTGLVAKYNSNLFITATRDDAMNFSIVQEKDAKEPKNSIDKFMKKYIASDPANENRFMKQNGASLALIEMPNSIPKINLHKQTEIVLQKIRNQREAKEKTVSFFYFCFENVVNISLFEQEKSTSSLTEKQQSFGRPLLSSVEQKNTIQQQKQNARQAKAKNVSVSIFRIELFVFQNTCEYFSLFYQAKKSAPTTLNKPNEELVTFLGPNLRSTSRTSQANRLSDDAAVGNVFNRVQNSKNNKTGCFLRSANQKNRVSQGSRLSDKETTLNEEQESNEESLGLNLRSCGQSYRACQSNGLSDDVKANNVSLMKLLHQNDSLIDVHYTFREFASVLVIFLSNYLQIHIFFIQSGAKLGNRCERWKTD